MSELRPSACACPQVVGIAEGTRRDFHSACRVLDRSCRKPVQRAAYHRIRTHVRPVVVRVAQEVGQPIEDGTQLLPTADEPPGKLRDRLRVVPPKILRIQHARSIERNVEAVRRWDVAVDGLGKGAAGLDHLRAHGCGHGSPRGNFRGDFCAQREVAWSVRGDVTTARYEGVDDGAQLLARDAQGRGFGIPERSGRSVRLIRRVVYGGIRRGRTKEIFVNEVQRTGLKKRTCLGGW